MWVRVEHAAGGSGYSVPVQVSEKERDRLDRLRRKSVETRYGAAPNIVTLDFPNGAQVVYRYEQEGEEQTP